MDIPGRSDVPGDLYMWGQGGPELGVTPDKEGTVPLPTRVGSLRNVVQVALGDTFTVVLTASGDVLTFGCNTKGRLLGRAGRGLLHALGRHCDAAFPRTLHLTRAQDQKLRRLTHHPHC